METAFNIQFQNPSADDRAGLMIEQEEWIPNIGMVTKARFYSTLRSTYYGYFVDWHEEPCGFVPGTAIIESIIYVYPSYPSLNYSLKTTYGTLGEYHSIDTYREQEIINFSITNTASFKYPADATPNYSWIGLVRNYQGNVIPNPVVTFDGNNIHLSDKVYGAMKLDYVVTRHKHILRVPPREDTAIDKFGAVVYGVFNGGVAWHEISNPPNADEIMEGEMRCLGTNWTNDSLGRTEEPDDPDIGSGGGGAFAVDETFTYDYCSGELTSYTKG